MGSDSIDYVIDSVIDSEVIDQYGGYTVGLGYGAFEREFFLGVSVLSVTDKATRPSRKWNLYINTINCKLMRKKDEWRDNR